MTAWHYRWLCQFAYIDLPAAAAARQGWTLGRIAGEMMRLDGEGKLECGRLAAGEKEALEVIRSDPELRALVLAEYVNQNEDTGLAAYAFRAGDGSVHCVFRGSETRGCGVPTGVDWIDNILAPFHGSVQYPGIERLAGRFAGERVVFSGHSKGAHNALYALAVTDGEMASAVAFNGQGFMPGQLDGRQRARLERRGVNYVVRGDAVGSLLWHPERRIFVRRRAGEHPHALSAFEFDRQGRPEKALRPLWSVALEWGSRAAAAGIAEKDGRGSRRMTINKEML